MLKRREDVSIPKAWGSDGISKEGEIAEQDFTLTPHSKISSRTLILILKSAHDLKKNSQETK